MTKQWDEVKVAVDDLGWVKARIAEEKQTEETLKAIIIGAAAEGPESAFEGEQFRATVSFSKKYVIDYNAVIGALAVAFDIPGEAVQKAVKQYTKVAEGVPCVRVSARKG